MVELMSAFGLSAATGLNAYLPLLILGLLGRFTELVTLKAPWDALENTWVLVVIAALLLIETVLDKIPAVDTINDVVQTLTRPGAGAILFAAGSNVISEMREKARAPAFFRRPKPQIRHPGGRMTSTGMLRTSAARAVPRTSVAETAATSSFGCIRVNGGFPVFPHAEKYC